MNWKPVAVLVFLAAIYFVLQHPLIDRFLFPPPPPGAEILALADSASMTKLGREIFFSSRPNLIGREEIITHCGKVTKETRKLGCFKVFYGRQRIFLLDLRGSALRGMMESTAGHEMLHAAYDSFIDEERLNFRAHAQLWLPQVTEERIQKKIDSYRLVDEENVWDEVHSILGTEVAALSPELESHYSKYFGNRQLIVHFSNILENKLETKQKTIEAYDAELKQQRLEIEKYQALLDQSARYLRQEQAHLSAFQDDEENEKYNLLAAEVNGKIAQHNAIQRQFEVLVGEFNSLIKKRNSVVAEAMEFDAAIDKALPEINAVGDAGSSQPPSN